MPFVFYGTDTDRKSDIIHSYVKLVYCNLLPA